MTYSTSLVSLFKIPGCFVRNISVAEREIIVEVYRRRKTGICPLCFGRTTRIHERRVRKVLHEIIGVQKVYLVLTYRRFFCSVCRRRFAEDIPFLMGKKRRTENVTASIVSRLRRESFRSTTEATGVSYGGLRENRPPLVLMSITQGRIGTSSL